MGSYRYLLRVYTDPVVFNHCLTFGTEKVKHTHTHTPGQYRYLLVASSPICVHSAEVCPLLSGYNVHHTAPPDDSERQPALDRLCCVIVGNGYFFGVLQYYSNTS